MKKKELKQWTEADKVAIDFKKVAGMKKKELRSFKYLEKQDGYTIIPSRKSYIDLADYNKNPDRYLNDVTVLRKDIKYIVTDERFEDMYIDFTLTEDTEIRSMSQIHFLFNLIMWKPFFVLGIPITEDLIFMPKTFNNKSYVNYVNNKIIIPYKHLTTHNEMSSLLADMYDNVVFLCEDVGILLGISFNLNEMFEAWDKVQELFDICHTEIPENMQINEAERYIKEQGERMYDIFMNHHELDDTNLKALLRASTLSPKQVREFYTHVGYKPDLDGNTIPYTTNTNLVTKGFDTMEGFVLDSRGGRKAAILALQISDGGYFSRLASKCCDSIVAHPDPKHNCGSEHYYRMHIKDKSDVETMNGRWYLNEKDNILEQCSEDDVHLIGKTLKFRTPTTCASKDGICKICYGSLFNQNYGINIGVNAALKISERNLNDRLAKRRLLVKTSYLIAGNY